MLQDTHLSACVKTDFMYLKHATINPNFPSTRPTRREKHGRCCHGFYLDFTPTLHKTWIYKQSSSLAQ